MLDKITELKAKGYDLIAQLEAVQKELASVNREIELVYGEMSMQVNQSAKDSVEEEGLG